MNAYGPGFAALSQAERNEIVARDAADYRRRSTAPKLKTAAAFCAEYVPLSYAVEPIIRSRSIYTLTARTCRQNRAHDRRRAGDPERRKGHLGFEVEKGRVGYLAFENADDVRMRLMIASFLHNVDLGDLGDRLVVLDVRQKPEDVIARLSADGGGPFSLILADTLAAWFDGKDINDNVAAGEFVRRARPLTNLPGNPSVLIAAHPTKGAGEDQLVPYGGGAILNEVDGNLTLWRNPETGGVTLHWQGKLRGLEFKPRPFRFEIVGSPDILDAKGRQVQLPVLRPTSEADVEARQAVEANLDVALLRVVKCTPEGKQADWAAAIGRDKSNVNRRLQTLKADKLVEVTLGRWTLTPKGEKAVSGGEK